jgi:ATP-dependent DNA ligase
MMLPRVQPIVPTRRKEPSDDPDWLFDLKYDGFRALCYVEQGRGRLISRNGNQLTRFAALADELASVLAVEAAILDGEVIAADETGRPQFYDLLRGTRAPAYVAFEHMRRIASGRSPRNIGSVINKDYRPDAAVIVLRDIPDEARVAHNEPPAAGSLT